MRSNRIFLGLSAFLLCGLAPLPALAQDMACRAEHEAQGVKDFGLRRTICADVVALDQTLVYNRFGSFNPYGMIFALRRDVVPVDQTPEGSVANPADRCDEDLGVSLSAADLKPGAVKLRECKRPRPLTLRANVGDLLAVRLENLLYSESDQSYPKAPSAVGAPDFSDDFCPERRSARFPAGLGDAVSVGPSDLVAHGEAACPEPPSSGEKTATEEETPPDWPTTRGVNFAIQGLQAVRPDGEPVDPRCLGQVAIAPGEQVLCHYAVLREGPYFAASTAAPSGGEGDGGSLTHGLFAAVNVEKTGTRWYRSQISKGAMALARRTAPAGQAVDYAARVCPGDASSERPEWTTDCASEASGGAPLLEMLRLREPGAHEVFHADLNAIIEDPEALLEPEHRDAQGNLVAARIGPRAFREFSVFFHDELKTFYTRNFEELGLFGAAQLAGARDAFAINYGASGMGSLVLANRKGIGPAANCAECLYEEFFLTSWANGDPALLEHYPDDPSNVHHSYLNDAVVFRNFHAGPKETHVFHLHAHQWFAGNDSNRGAYLDSQTVGPQQAFSYDINAGGLEVYRRGIDGRGWWETLGSGNRNRTAGDSIFHCHLYPHFAQGMWELWRVHDVFEDGGRKLPDGQWKPGFSFQEEPEAVKAMSRPGSVHRETGQFIRPAGNMSEAQIGTPIPAIVPLPHQAAPPAPSYPEALATLNPESGAVEGIVRIMDPVTGGEKEVVSTFPGYPFYIPGHPGHRPPQAPLDIARDHASEGDAAYLDGGLPRHVAVDGSTRAPEFSAPAPEDLPSLDGEEGRREREIVQARIVAKALALGDMTMKLKTLNMELLPYEGSPIERAAMAFHHDGSLEDGKPLKVLSLKGVESVYDPQIGAYDLEGEPFAVNGAPPKPGAPYADPCGAPDAFGRILRQEDGSYTVLDGSPNPPVLKVEDGATGGLARDMDVVNWANRRLPGTLTQRLPTLFYIDAQDRKHVLDRSGALPSLAGAPLLVSEADPFVRAGSGGSRFTSDPGVIGFRRYEASAVQVDLVTNRAGWHDPQARINVLTEKSDGYKDGEGKPAGRFTPLVSAGEQPFFFRAWSGECVEFRHTNELPKDLEMDDFQVRTPTDTIGQHIHLVKFDVTASDGSANGWNYEDGTFAPDEIAARICAARNLLDPDKWFAGPERGAGDWRIRMADGLCAKQGDLWEPALKDIWRLKRSAHPELFQTTVQRWFADPILSEIRHPRDEQRAQGEVADPTIVDRTMRTVFSHDHFGASSIQQHGFYSALVIEKQGARICSLKNPSASKPEERLAHDEGDACRSWKGRELLTSGEADVGPRKALLLQGRNARGLEEEILTREYALAVADFALLYDPRDRTTARELAADKPANASRMQGMAMLLCEAQHAGDPRRLNAFCNSGMKEDEGRLHGSEGQVPPAWFAWGRSGDLDSHRLQPVGRWSASSDEPILLQTEIEKLREHLLVWRANAAGYALDAGERIFARPVAPPRRPESISVDHHDPYLLNYRGEPIPLRIGEGSGSDCELQGLEHWATALSGDGVQETCSIDRQKHDMADAFRSSLGEPVTPILESRDGEQVAIRLIQGAQEVQHSFTIEDHMLRRNIDQNFPSGMIPHDDVTPIEVLSKECEAMGFGEVALSRLGRPDHYPGWFNGPKAEAPDAPFRLWGPDGAIPAFWEAYERRLARCFNAEGRVSTQEVGISEHFEFAAAYLYDTNLMGPERFRLKLRIDERERAHRRTSRGDDSPAKREDFKVAELTEGLKMEGSPPDTSDSLIHFGSQDSLWNGAWGLLRVHKPQEQDEASQDIRPAALCHPEARRIQATVAAVSTRQLHEGAQTHPRRGFSSGTEYARGLKDPDGLFFALIDPASIVGGKQPEDSDEAAADPANPLTWPPIPREAVLKAVLEAYARPEPLVLYVNAGDCLRLTMINALDPNLKDGLGDARMPPITPLNVDPDWPDMHDPLTPEEVSAEGSRDGRELLRPSSSLAVNLPLPTMNLLSTTPRIMGGVSSPAAEDGWLQLLGPPNKPNEEGQIQILEMYAGFATRLSSVSDKTAEQQRSEEVSRLFAPYVETVNKIGAKRGAPGALTISRGDSPELTLTENARKFTEPLSGDDVKSLRAAKETLLQSLQQTLREQALHEQTLHDQAQEARFIPYAFGALPLRSNADLISHVTHGLFGSIVVIPKDARLLEPTTSERRSIPEASCDLLLGPRGDAPSCETVQITPTGNGVPKFGESLFELDRLDKVVSGADAERTSTSHRVRQFTLFWQDGLNLHDEFTRDRHRLHFGADGEAPGKPEQENKLVADCLACGDSYDWGEKGVSYRSAPFHIRLRGEASGASNPPESHYDLNAFDFGRDFWRLRAEERENPPMPVLRAVEGEEVVIHVVHPGGRARQRAFVAIGQDYDDLFPGFGFPRAALLAPGKALTASFTMPVREGCHLWFDGPTTTRAGGAWGLLEVVSRDHRAPEAGPCSRGR